MPCAIGEYALSANFDFLRPLQGPDMPCAIGEYALSATTDHPHFIPGGGLAPPPDKTGLVTMGAGDLRSRSPGFDIHQPLV